MKPNKKILILVPHLSSIGGVQNYFRTLQLEMDGNIRYFTVNKLHQQSRVVKAFRVLYFYCLFIYRLVKEGHQLVHVNPSIEYKSFYRESIFILISKVLNRKTLIFFRGWREEFEDQIRKSSLKSYLFRISYGRADKFIVLSELFKAKLIELGVPQKAEFFLETTVADSKYVKELKLEQKFQSFNQKVVLLFLSKVERTKGVYIAIDAYKKFADTYPERPCSLIIAGEGSELPAVKQYVREQNLKEVHFPGYVTDEMKKKVLLDAHIMLFPSYTEGLPNTILEGMLYGMPIISRITGAIPDIVRQGENGFLSESLDAPEYAQYISRLALDPRLYQKMAGVNHVKALENYTTEKVRDRMLNIYQTF